MCDFKDQEKKQIQQINTNINAHENAVPQQMNMPQQVDLQQVDLHQQANLRQIDLQQLRNLQADKAGQAFKSPLQLNTVKMDETVELTIPREQEIIDAYNEVEFESSDSAWKKSSRLNSAREKYNLQSELLNKEEMVPIQRPLKNISTKKAIDLSDKDLVKHYKEYNTEDDYLDRRYSLIRNKYYSLLPRSEIKKLKRPQLVQKTKELYLKDPRNDELIRYFQNMIAIRDYEADVKKGKKKPEDPKVKTIPSKESLKKENGAAAKKAEKYITNICADEEARSERIAAMKSVMIPESAETSWRLDKDDLVSSSQKEGIRQILAWMYRNCLKTSESKEPFVYKLTSQEPERLLLMFYLIENGLKSAPTTAVMASAMDGYVPDLDRFKDVILSSKIKFWKRLRSDAADTVIDWTTIGNAARFVLGNEIITDYITGMKEVKASEKDISDNRLADDKIQRDLLLDSLSKRGNLLITLYRSCGLTKDMPLSLVEDPKMRQLISDNLSKFIADSQKLVALLKITGIENEDILDKKSIYASNVNDAYEPPEKADDTDDSFGFLDKGGAGIGVVLSSDSIMSALGDLTATISELDLYSGSVSCLGTLGSILGIVSAIKTIAEVADVASSMSVADHVAQAISASADFIGGLADGVQSAADAVGTIFVNLGETGSATGFVEGGVRSAGQAFSTTAGAIEFCTGCVSIAAGMLQTTAGAIQLGRSLSSRNDITRARLRLSDAKKKADLTDENKEQLEHLERFLSHQSRTADAQLTSAGVSMVSGSLLMFGGALTVSGILAPLGGALTLIGAGLDIGYSLIGARKIKRNNRKKTVDEALKVDIIMQDLRKVSPGAKKMKDSDLREAVRQDLLGAMGYVNYKEYFAHLCHESAEFIYDHVFGDDVDEEEYPMYEDALKSLGLKIRIPKKDTDEPFPTAEEIYSKLME